MGICTSDLTNPHPPGGFRLNNPQLNNSLGVVLTFLIKNVAKLCLCHTGSATTEADSFISAARQSLKLHHEVLCSQRPSAVIIITCTYTHVHLHTDSQNVLITNLVPLRGFYGNIPARGEVGHDNDRCISAPAVEGNTCISTGVCVVVHS